MNLDSSPYRRRALGLLVSAIALAVLPTARAAGPWPEKPLRIVVPYPAGGPTDSAARQLADRLARVLSQAIVVDNRAGAGGTMGMDAVAHAAPDGATFGFAAISPLTLSPHIMKVGYDPLKDLVPVVSVMYAPVYVLATQAFKGQSFADAVAQAKAQPQGVSIASSGYGSVGHIMIEQLRRQSGANFVHVPYKGGSQIATDAAGAQFDLFMANPTDAIHALIQKGKLRVIAVSAPEQLPALPNMPTLAELGYKNANLTSLFGFYAPAGTPPEVVQRLNSEVNKLLSQSDMRERLRKLDNIATGGTPGQFAAVIQAEHATNGKIIREANIKAE